MAKKKVLKASNTQTYLPLTGFGVIWLFMDKYNCPSWGYGIFWTLFVIIFISIIYQKVYEEEIVDIFKDK